VRVGFLGAALFARGSDWIVMLHCVLYLVRRGPFARAPRAILTDGHRAGHPAHQSIEHFMTHFDDIAAAHQLFARTQPLDLPPRAGVWLDLGRSRTIRPDPRFHGPDALLPALIEHHCGVGGAAASSSAC
jgi:hypothetical protein